MDGKLDWRGRLALAALLALGTWPFLGGLGLWPMAPDSGLWIARGAPIDPDWSQWVFGTRHFHVGYRPVTALSYTLNYALGGLAPLPYRVTDLLLHLGAAIGVFAISRRLFRETSLWPALLATGLFLTHPAIEQAVPYIARRSYSLSTALALAGLATWLGPADRRPRPASMRPILAGVLLALALLSNEIAILPIATLPLLAWLRAGPGHGRLGRCLPGLLAPGLLLGLTLLVRLWVVGGVGGYSTESGDTARVLPVFAAAARAAAGLPTPTAPAAPWTPWLLLGIALPYYLLRCLAGPAERRILGLWILATAALFALQEVWFPRQGHAFAAPVALLAAQLLCETLRSPHTAARRLLELVPQALLIIVLLSGSAVVRGPDVERTREWAQRDALIDDMFEQIGSLDEGCNVHTVSPFERPEASTLALRGDAAQKLLPRSARQPVTWLKVLLGERDVRVQEFAYVLRGEGVEFEAPVIEQTGTPPVLVLPEQREYLLRRGARWIPFDAAAERRVPLAPATHEEGRALFAYLAGLEDGELLPLD